MGYFLHESYPREDGEYTYEPYRGPGQFDLGVAFRGGERCECYYDAEQQRVTFIVVGRPSYGRLLLADFVGRPRANEDA